MRSERLRLFYALWADARLRRGVGRLVRSWRSSLSCRWVVPDKLHVTLAFLGDMPIERMGDLYGIGESIAVPPFELEFDRLEIWKRAEVLCLIPSAMPEPLLLSVNRLHSALEQAGFSTEKRAFRPHLTLARGVRSLPDGGAGFPGVVFAPERWSLAESRPDEHGAPYRVLRSWPLLGLSPDGTTVGDES
jgi:2'-5' RNA ligase